MKTIFLVGESVIDLISTNIVSSLDDADSFLRFSGGEVANLAINLACLGHPVSFGTCLGEDGFGRYILSQLKEAGVNLNLVQTTTQAPTTSIIITRQTKTPDFIIFRGADHFLNITPELRDEVENSHAIHTSAFSLSRNPARDTILELIELAYNHGKMISLDPNFHPGILPDKKDFISWMKNIFKSVTITKPSLDDSIRLFGNDLDPRDYLEAFLDLGPKIVALTMGSRGVLLGTSKGERYSLKANLTPVVDVTGAGDAFWAGMLSGLLEGYPPVEACQIGQAIAEYKIGVLGPVINYPNLSTFREEAKSIQVTTI